MERAGTSSERTPLVQPTYVFESTLSRQYRKRLRNCQCAVCVSILVLLSVILLVTVSYNLANDIDDDDNSTFVPIPIPVTNISTDNISLTNLTDTGNSTNVKANLTNGTSGANLTASGGNLKASGPNLTGSSNFTSHNLTAIQPNLQPIINQKWPLEGKPSTPWPHTPSPQNISAAVTAGKEALAQQQKAERVRRALAPNTPAHRAQRAAATAVEVKPLADAAFAAEEATRALVNG